MSGMEGTAKERILECARKLFSEYTFSQVSMKDIAKSAGVSVALVVKHFGSKGQLFAATIDFTDSRKALFGGPFERIGYAAVEETLTAPYNAPYSMARTISIAAGDSESLEDIGKRIKADLALVLQDRIQREAPEANPSPRLRAQAALSLLMGLSFMRRFGDTDFEKYDRDELIADYAPRLQAIIDGDS